MTGQMMGHLYRGLIRPPAVASSDSKHDNGTPVYQH